MGFVAIKCIADLPFQAETCALFYYGKSLYSLRKIAKKVIVTYLKQ